MLKQFAISRRSGVVTFADGGAIVCFEASGYL